MLGFMFVKSTFLFSVFKCDAREYKHPKNFNNHGLINNKVLIPLVHIILHKTIEQSNILNSSMGPSTTVSKELTSLISSATLLIYIIFPKISKDCSNQLLRLVVSCGFLQYVV